MPTKQAPGYNSPETLAAAAALVALINTRAHAGYGDSLLPGGAEEILGSFAGGRGVGDPDLASVGRLRGALARTLGHDAVERERAWGEVSELLKPVTVRRVFSASGVRLEPAEGAPVLAGIAAAVQALVDADSWPRLRVCPNHLCNRAFYDSTRSRTQRWDSFDTCGNKANVAAHRARVRERAGK